MESYKHPYDELSIVKVFFFFALFLMVSIFALTIIYPWYLEQRFADEITQELGMLTSFFGADLYVRLLVRGDELYHTLFIASGIETWAYGHLLSKQTGIGISAQTEYAFVGGLLDNIFDYLLLLCYRVGVVIMLASVGFFLMLAVMGDGFIRRGRRRYSFGDSSVVVNVWSRSFAGYMVPAFFIILMLPLAIHPTVIMCATSLLSLSFSFFMISLPKMS